MRSRSDRLAGKSVIIGSIELKSYRNYEKLHMGFNQGTNILYRDNAQGKANILETAYAYCVSKLHKNVKDRDIIRFNQDEPRTKLQVRRNNVPYHIDVYLKEDKPKGIAISGVPACKASELFGIANVVFFSPEDLSIIKNRLSERKRFTDMELCQLSKLYVHSLVQYNKVLLQRNKLLRELFFRPEYEETLDVWDMQLVSYGYKAIKFRRGFIKQPNEIIHAIYPSLTGGREDTTIFYGPYIPQDQMGDVLKRDRAQDMKQKTTLSGPHKDDIGFIVNDTGTRRFGPQGQQCAMALSLKLSELELVKQLSHNDSILPLDDVLSELDSSRQNHLLSAIRHIQTMITCTGLDDFVSNRFQIDKVFKVINGAIINEDQCRIRKRG